MARCVSAKTSKARRAAFLKALSETGNQALSAERAKVSRSWVCLKRSTDPEFDAACREAIQTAKESFDWAPASAGEQGGSRKPPKGWAFHAGEELVVSGTNGVRMQIRRAKLRQWTPRVEERFLSALSASCNVKASLAAVGMSHGSAYAHRKRFPAFARAWDEAVAIGMTKLEAALVENIDYAFDPEAPPPELEVREVTIMDLIRTLRMYQRRDMGK